MIPEIMWPGFQAEAGKGNTATMRSTKNATRDTVATYVISNEQWARKRFWTTGNKPQ
jgi:hypothetical protein